METSGSVPSHSSGYFIKNNQKDIVELVMQTMK